MTCPVARRVRLGSTPAAATCFKFLVRDLRAVLHLLQGLTEEPLPVVSDGRTHQATCRGCPGQATTQYLPWESLGANNSYCYPLALNPRAPERSPM